MTQPWHDPSQPNQPFGGSPTPGPGGQWPQQPWGQPPQQPWGQPPQQPWGQPPQQPWQSAGPVPPQAPLGRQQLPTNDIARYAPPKPRGALVAVVAGVIVLASVVAAGLFLQRPVVPPAPTATPTPSVAGQSARPGQPFTMPNNTSATGRWEVLAREWSDAGVLLQVRVSCDTEVCSYGFTSFPTNGSNSVDPVASPRQPQLDRGTLRAGQSATGYVFLPISRGSAVLILTTSAGRQISALPISA